MARITRIADNNADYVTPKDMISERWEDNRAPVLNLKHVHSLCDGAGDATSASAIENWIDETQRRAWFLYETCGG